MLARQATVRVLWSRQAELLHLFENDVCLFQEHCHNMARQGTYIDGELEILAAAAALNANIYVFSAEKTHFYRKEDPDLHTTNISVVHFKEEEHYRLLIRKPAFQEAAAPAAPSSW
jgi:hypothetical protein